MATTMNPYAVDVQDATGDRFTLNYWTASVSAIPEAVAREAAQFLAAHPTQGEHATLTILAIRPR